MCRNKTFEHLLRIFKKIKISREMSFQLFSLIYFIIKWVINLYKKKFIEFHLKKKKVQLHFTTVFAHL